MDDKGGVVVPINPDTVFINGHLVTVDEANPRACAMAVRGEWIVAVGNDEEIRALRGPETREVDLGGLVVIPGFNDAHNHMLSFGLGLQHLDLRRPGLRRVEDIVALVAERVHERPTGTWVVGRGYDDNKLEGHRHPTRRELDVVSPDHPVLLGHTSGHMIVVNGAALKEAGIDRSSADPPGGRIVRDATGEPTGLLQETAQALVNRLLLPRSLDEVIHALGAASSRYLSQGITSAQEAGVGGTSPLELAGYQEAVRRGQLQVRVNLMIGVSQLHETLGKKGEQPRFGLDMGLHSGFGDHRLRIGPVKIFADGSLIGRTAALFDGYETEPDNIGFYATAPKILREQILRAHESGWQVAVHAIGDRAVSFVLDCYEEALDRHPRADHRHRVEHCGVLNNTLIDRIAELGVIPVPQQRFIYELGDGFIANLGRDRVQLTYPQRTLIDRCVLFPGSSDRPVVDGAPLLGIESAVNQMTAHGQPYVPEERITAEEALRAYTLHSAYCSFEEHIKGSLEPGKLADFAVLDRDLTSVPSDQLSDIQIVATAVGGRFRFGQEAFQ